MAAAESTPTAEDQHLAAQAQAEAFAELSASASLLIPEPVASVPAAVEYDDEPIPMYGSSDTDTASLLRELSSLGLEDDPPPVPVTRPRATPPRPVTSAAAKPKKKGLFGR